MGLAHISKRLNGSVCEHFFVPLNKMGKRAKTNHTSVPYKALYQKCLNSSGPEVKKLFSCSTQLSTKFILLINVKMPTIVGILTFISVINATSERFKAKNYFICQYFSFYEQLKFRAQLI